MATKAVVGKLSRRLQVRVLSGAPFGCKIPKWTQSDLIASLNAVLCMVSVAQLVEPRIVIP
ncbi:MAG: hypothetical protein KTR18_10595, partial [Acidiferrobacterales bacterium]|nr:hypothetical protein [Acidiferrobacterales bacterium]